MPTASPFISAAPTPDPEAARTDIQARDRLLDALVPPRVSADLAAVPVTPAMVDAAVGALSHADLIALFEEGVGLDSLAMAYRARLAGFRLGPGRLGEAEDVLVALVRRLVWRRAVSEVLAEPDAIWSPLLSQLCLEGRSHFRRPLPLIRAPWLPEAVDRAPPQVPLDVLAGGGPGLAVPTSADAASPDAASPDVVPGDRPSAWAGLQPLAQRATRLRLRADELSALIAEATPEPSAALEALLVRVRAPWTLAAVTSLLDGPTRRRGYEAGAATLYGLVQNPSVDDEIWDAVERRVVDTAFVNGDGTHTSLVAFLHWGPAHGRPRSSQTHARLETHVLASDLRQPDHLVLQLLQVPEVRRRPRVRAHVRRIQDVVHPAVRLLVEPRAWPTHWRTLVAGSVPEQEVARDLWPSLGVEHAAALTGSEWRDLLTGTWANPGAETGSLSGPLAHLTPTQMAAWSDRDRAEVLARAGRAMRLHMLRLLGARRRPGARPSSDGHGTPGPSPAAPGLPPPSGTPAARPRGGRT